MLQVKIKAGPITNLTAARYFAAWEVECLSFCCDPGNEHYISPAALAAIREWVDGPAIVGEFSFPQADTLQTACQTMQLDRIQVGMYTPVSVLAEAALSIPVIKEVVWSEDLNWEAHLLEYAPYVSYYLLNLSQVPDTKNPFLKPFEMAEPRWKQLVTEYDCWLFTPLPIEQVDDLLDWSVLGWQVSGGEEEAVGMKSFDDLDLLFERLEV